jgi:queuine tRNA-ribosyltransferase
MRAAGFAAEGRMTMGQSFGSPFEVARTCTSSHARLARLETLHGLIETPIFLPVGTQATVRTLTPQDMDEIGIEMILCNSYHLYLRPGSEVIKKAGGLHSFMAWKKPILTDSGGYQIFSLSSFRQITEDGVVFRSHIDGSEHRISPEQAMLLQEEIGADVIMALDVCPATSAKRDDVTKAVEYTSAWARRCHNAHTRTGQHLFGIIQGGIYPELRTISAGQITELGFAGYAIGGLSLGESKSSMWEMVAHTVNFMPVEKPRYLMGVGSPEDIVQGVALGIDIFDSALPTRVARNGALYTRSGRINIKRSKYCDDFGPVDDSCNCFTCKNFTAAYLHHLFKCEELLAYRLATIHNLFFMKSLVSEIRVSMSTGGFEAFKERFLASYRTTNEEIRIEQKSKSVGAKHRGDQGF